MFSDLDDPASLDPAVAGAKAAWLARGRRAGLPILPGIVIHAAAGRPAMALGAANLPHGTGRARLAIAEMDVAADLVGALPGRVAGLGPRLVVRSSSPLEGDGAWAGAFTSYLDVTADDLPTALRGCWASAFSNGAVERAARVGLDPGCVSLAVLIQPAIAPTFGGTARSVDDDIAVVAVRGTPAPLLQGWDPGVHGRILADGSVDGLGLGGLLGAEAIATLAGVLRSAWTETGATTAEWAIVDGQPTILQLGRETAARPRSDSIPLLVGDEADLARLERMARTIRHAPGPLGEALVLPWALGEGPVAATRPAAGDDTPAEPLDAAKALEAAAALDAAIALARVLTRDGWHDAAGDPDEAVRRAGAAVAALRGTDPGEAARTLAGRPAADATAATRLHRLLDRARAGLVAAGAAATADDAWYLTPDQAVAALAAVPASGRSRRAHRPRLDPWLPFQAAVILATGRRSNGVASGPGLGVGRLAVVDDARRPDRVGARDVLLAPRPLPHLAPLLWDAAAVVTAGGGPGAHLFESARALGLPAVSGLGVDDFLAEVLAGGSESWAMAVDGSAGSVAITPW